MEGRKLGIMQSETLEKKDDRGKSLHTNYATPTPVLHQITAKTSWLLDSTQPFYSVSHSVFLPFCPFHHLL